VLSVISVALSVVAVVVAGVAFLVAVGERRRCVQVAGEGEPRQAGTAPRARGGARPEHDAVDPRALRDVAVIRYDALQEMSGQMSFSLALLNSLGDGIVVSSINGRAETRTYAKTVVAGQGAQELSPEEQEAIRVARLGRGLTAPRQVTARPKITSQTGAASIIR
jgi:hypothetical protein